MVEPEFYSSLTHGSLFSGIGGFDYTSELSGWTNLFNCEIDPFCRTTLNYYYPDARQYTDIKKTDFSEWKNKVDVLSGGFPCQPFSCAGNRRGTDDDRYLWPEMLRAIREIQPRWVVGENVLGIVNWNAGMVFEQVCSDLETEDYEVQPFVLPACGIDAPHRRYRTFFIAYRANAGTQKVQFNREDSLFGFVKTATTDSDICLHFRTERTSSVQTNSIPSVDRSEYCSSGQSFGTDSCDSEGSKPDKLTADTDDAGGSTSQRNSNAHWSEVVAEWEQSFCGISGFGDTQYASDTQVGRLQNRRYQPLQFCTHTGIKRYDIVPDWKEFPTQPPVCRGDDGLSDLLDADAVYKGRTKVNRKHPFARWRTESLKGYGNAIVPPLIFRIFQVINKYEAGEWGS